MEKRRLQAAALFEQGGLSQAEIGRRLGVSHQTVSDWHEYWAKGGAAALRGAGRAGRMRRLSAEQLAEVESALAKGALANGYSTDLWTLSRVAEIIEKTTGVRFSYGHTWRVLREQLGWSRQRPARRAVERDNAAVERWVKEEWPKLKKGHAGGAH
jgi:transposase